MNIFRKKKEISEPVTSCYGCKCLINRRNVLRVETQDMFLYGLPVFTSEYYCHRCKPNYDRIIIETGTNKKIYQKKVDTYFEDIKNPKD